MSGFLSMLSALASLKSTPFCSDGDNVELIVIVLLIWLVRALSRRLVFFNRTTRTIADNISKKAPNIPNKVPRNGFTCRNAGANAGEISEKGNTTKLSKLISFWLFIFIDSCQSTCLFLWIFHCIRWQNDRAGFSFLIVRNHNHLIRHSSIETFKLEIWSSFEMENVIIEVM